MRTKNIKYREWRKKIKCYDKQSMNQKRGIVNRITIRLVLHSVLSIEQAIKAKQALADKNEKLDSEKFVLNFQCGK